MIPVLTYHGVNIHRNDYAGNDHLALAADLAMIHDRGLRIVPLADIAAWVRGEVDDSVVAGGVGLSFDDGSWFDWHDLDHPACGPQRSLAGILRDFTVATGAPAAATSFVIVSPHARAVLDRTCLVGRDWWGDDWWPEAVREGVLDVASHSWDHLHPTLETVAHSRNEKGDFTAVDNADDAAAQVDQASGYIERRTGRRPGLFAYPWGQVPDYLAATYLPERGRERGLSAAFTTEPRAVARDDDPWRLPRYTCGTDWASPAGLAAILDAAASRAALQTG